MLKAWLKNLAAVLFGLALIVLLELLLSLVGVTPLSQEDVFVGFSGESRIFLPEGSSGQVFHLNPAKAAYFNEQHFSMPKKEGVFRLLVLGGSTTYGRPFLGHTAFASWLQRLLEKYSPGLKVDVINAGGISYASYRLKRLLPELLSYRPDLVVIYAGHNEFLERRTFDALLREPERKQQLRSLLHHSRLYSSLYRGLAKLRPGKKAAGKTVLGEDVEAVLEQVGGQELYHRDPDFRAGVVEQYRYSMAEMAQAISREKIPLVLCTLPVNLSGISPFKSEHRSNLSQAEWRAWQKAYMAAEASRTTGDLAGALKGYEEALAIDDQYAALWYSLGLVLLQTGRFEDAHTALSRARQEDVVPLRALSEFNAIIRQLAEKNKLLLADVENFFSRISPDGIPGNNLFADHVHPTIEGQQIVAWVIMNAATQAGVVPLSPQQWQEDMVSAKGFLASELAAIPERYRARGLWGVGRLYYWAGKYPEAERALRLAWKTVKDEPEIPRQLGNLALWRGKGSEALEFLSRAEELDPDNRWIQFGQVQALLLLGQGEQALALLDRVQWPDEMSLRLTMARCRALFQTGDRLAAQALLDHLPQGESGVAATEAELGRLYALAGREHEAKDHYLESLVLERHPTPELALEKWWASFHAEGGER